MGAPQTLHTPPETARCAAASSAAAPAPRSRRRPVQPPLGRRRRASGSRPDLAAFGPHAAAPPRPGQPPNPCAASPTRPGFRAPRTRAAPRPATPSVCLRAAPPAPLARLRVCPRWRPPRPAAPRARHSGTAALCPGDRPARNGAVLPRPGPKGLCPPRGDQIPKSGALETAAPSRANFRKIQAPGFWPQKQKSAISDAQSAVVAQLAEQLLCKQPVCGSSPHDGSTRNGGSL